MKTTTTIAEYVKSELLNINFNFYTDNNLITFYDNLINQKLIKYDSDISYILSRTIFLGLDNLSLNFKKAFINRFYSRVIKFQTIELFSEKLFSELYPRINYLNELFDNSLNYINGKKISENVSNSEGENRNNQLYADLPQTQTDISLSIDSLDYATNTTLNKSKDTNNSNSINTQTDFNVDNLNKFNNEINIIFKELDKKLFSQII